MSIKLATLLAYNSIGVFGGSFDPPHQGHLLLATTVLQRLKLDCIVFVPAKRNPLKQDKPHASDDQRLAMLQLLIAAEPCLVISDIELQSPHTPSYSVETLREFRSLLGAEKKIYFILGADSYRDFNKWREPEVIRSLATLVVVSRSYAEKDRQLAVNVRTADSSVLMINEVQLPHYSSTEVREQLAQGIKPAGLSEPVYAFIQQHGLYRVQ